MIHDSFINHDFIVKLISILVFLHIVCWTSIYYLAFKYELIRYPYLFLSTAFGWDPARAVASFILPVISLLTGLLMYLRAMLIKPRLKTPLQRRIWKLLNLCTILTCVGLLGVSAISIYTNIYVHLVFAFALFIAGILIMVLSSVLDRILRLPVSPAISAARLVLAAIGVGSGVCLGFVFIPYPFIGSLMEMLTVAAMTAYFCTFAHKLEKVDIMSVIAGESSPADRLNDHRSVSRRRVV